MKNNNLTDATNKSNFSKLYHIQRGMCQLIWHHLIRWHMLETQAHTDSLMVHLMAFLTFSSHHTQRRKEWKQRHWLPWRALWDEWLECKSLLPAQVSIYSRHCPLPPIPVAPPLHYSCWVISVTPDLFPPTMNPNRRPLTIQKLTLTSLNISRTTQRFQLTDFHKAVQYVWVWVYSLLYSLLMLNVWMLPE